MRCKYAVNSMTLQNLPYLKWSPHHVSPVKDLGIDQITICMSPSVLADPSLTSRFGLAKLKTKQLTKPTKKLERKQIAFDLGGGKVTKMPNYPER